MIFTARRSANRKGSPDPRDAHGRVGYGPHILCGFGQASMGNFCNETIAWIAERHPGLIAIPDGLTDVGTPGTYRLGKYAAKRQAAGRTILRKRRDAPRLVDFEGYPAPLRMVAPPVVLPCAKGHLSRVEAS